MARLPRLLVLGGAAGLILAVVLPWVTILGNEAELGPADAAEMGAGAILGTETVLWPFVLGTAAVVAGLALLGKARKLLLAVGLLVIAAGGALLYCLANLVELYSSINGITDGTSSRSSRARSVPAHR